MKYLVIFIISSLFTLNVLAVDVCDLAWATSTTEAQVRDLINQGVNFEQECDDGNTPLSLLDNREFFSIISSKLSERNARGARLIEIIREWTWVSRKESEITWIFENLENEDLNPVNYQNENENDGGTALMWATYYGYRGLVSILLSNGANINAQNPRGETALRWILDRNDHQMRRNHTADSFMNMNPNHINDQNSEGETILMWAVLESNLDMIRMLIDRGINLDVEDYQGNTAIMHAARIGRGWVVQMLIDAGATYDAEHIYELLDSSPWYQKTGWSLRFFGRELLKALGNSTRIMG